MQDTPDYLAALNPEQRAAASAEDGPVLIVAGAGSGKTRLLVARVRRLIDRGADPGSILAVTFTRKAADEMRERLRTAIGEDASCLTIGTFHSVGALLLRSAPGVADLRDGFGIATDEQARRVLRDVALDIRSPGEAGPDTAPLNEGRLDEVLERISAFKDQVLDPAAAATWIEEARDGAAKPSEAAVVAAALYRPYLDALRRENLADFGDPLLWPVWAMIADESRRSAWAGRWSHILVDEYQDTNRVQHRFLSLLGGNHRNLFCVGDEDQAIYGFRRADVRYILEFEDDYPGAQVFRLETNYRSSPLILAAANAVIGRNRDRRGKVLRPAEPAEGDVPGGAPLRVVEAGWPEDEAAWIAADVRETLAVADGPVFILYRANWLSRAIEEALIDADVDYRIVGDLGFYAREEIRDAVAYLALAADGTDAEAFARAVNKPARGMGPASQRVVADFAKGGDLVEATLRAASDKLLPRGETAAAAVQRFAEALLAWRCGGEDHPADRFERLLEQAGYLEFWRASADPRAGERLDNVKELVASLERKSLDAVFDRVRRGRGDGADDAQVTLMTIHASKGLEAPAVYLAGWAEGLFPSKSTITKARRHRAAMEEERRLAYVGITRAKRRLCISWPSILRSGPTAGPSRFLSEIPKPLIDRIAAEGRKRPPSPAKLRFARDILAQLGLDAPGGLESDAMIADRVIENHYPALRIKRERAPKR